jgi:hypothetical protein
VEEKLKLESGRDKGDRDGRMDGFGGKGQVKGIGMVIFGVPRSMGTLLIGSGNRNWEDLWNRSSGTIMIE